MIKRYVSKEDITSGVYIMDIAAEFGVELEDVSSGNFDKRCKCPSEEHKNGGERTGSLYIDSKRNNFYCFGCNTGSNSIDFYMLCTGITFGEAVSELRKRVKPGTISSINYPSDTNNFYTLLEISKLFRNTILSHKDDLKWINQLMKYTDQFIIGIDPQDDKKAKAILNEVQKTIKNRYEAK